MELVKQSRVNQNNDSKTVRILHTIAVLMVLAGAGASIGFTIHTGRNNPSILLILLFTGWVVSPFIALLLINVVSRRSEPFNRLILHSLMILITLGSVILYSGLWSPPGAKTAFVYLVGPLLSWSLMGTILIAAKLSPSR